MSTRTNHTSRYSRKPGLLPEPVIRERDRKIIGLVYKHRFLDTNLIWSLIGTHSDSGRPKSRGADGKLRPVSYGFGQKALYKRLQILYHTGYLDRHYLTDSPIGRGSGVPRAIYGLGAKSTKIVSDLSGIGVQEARRIVESNSVKSPYLRHALAIARFRAMLSISCERSGGVAKIDSWLQGQLLRDSVSVNGRNGKRERYSVYPDAVFGLFVKGRGVSTYFLEIDRGTMPIASVARERDICNKLKGLYYYRRIGKYTGRYFNNILPDSTTNTLIVSNSGGRGMQPIRGFSVLYVVVNERTARQSTSSRVNNIMVVLPRLGSGMATSSMFWFGTMDSRVTVESGDVFDISWMSKSPRNPNPTLW